MKKKIPILIVILLLILVSFLYLRTFKYHFNKTELARIDSNVFTRYRKPHPIHSFNAKSSRGTLPFTAKSFENSWSFIYIGAPVISKEQLNNLSILNTLMEKISQNQSVHTKVQLLYLSAAPELGKFEMLTKELMPIKNILALKSTNNDETNLSILVHAPIFKSIDSKTNSVNVSHPKNLYLISPNQQLVGYFSHPFDVNFMYKNFIRIYNCGPQLCVK